MFMVNVDPKKDIADIGRSVMGYEWEKPLGIGSRSKAPSHRSGEECLDSKISVKSSICSAVLWGQPKE